MTIQKLESCYLLRKELALTERRIKSCTENSQQKQRLENRATELMVYLDEIQDYIESLESSLLRQIITLRYFEGLTYKETADYVGYSSKQTRRILHNHFSGGG